MFPNTETDETLARTSEETKDEENFLRCKKTSERKSHGKQVRKCRRFIDPFFRLTFLSFFLPFLFFFGKRSRPCIGPLIARPSNTFRAPTDEEEPKNVLSTEEFQNSRRALNWNEAQKTFKFFDNSNQSNMNLSFMNGLQLILNKWGKDWDKDNYRLTRVVEIFRGQTETVRGMVTSLCSSWEWSPCQFILTDVASRPDVLPKL